MDINIEFFTHVWNKKILRNLFISVLQNTLYGICYVQKTEIHCQMFCSVMDKQCLILII